MLNNPEGKKVLSNFINLNKSILADHLKNGRITNEQYSESLKRLLKYPVKYMVDNINYAKARGNLTQYAGHDFSKWIPPYDKLVKDKGKFIKEYEKSILSEYKRNDPELYKKVEKDKKYLRNLAEAKYEDMLQTSFLKEHTAKDIIKQMMEEHKASEMARKEIKRTKPIDEEPKKKEEVKKQNFYLDRYDETTGEVIFTDKPKGKNPWATEISEEILEAMKVSTKKGKKERKFGVPLNMTAYINRPDLFVKLYGEMKEAGVKGKTEETTPVKETSATKSTD